MARQEITLFGIHINQVLGRKLEIVDKETGKALDVQIHYIWDWTSFMRDPPRVLGPSSGNKYLVMIDIEIASI
jgi:hypothetical protein